MYAATGGWGYGHFNSDGNLVTRRYSRLALVATQWLLAILSSRVTHLNNSGGWNLALGSGNRRLPEKKLR
jgi:hypothetical protein